MHGRPWLAGCSRRIAPSNRCVMQVLEMFKTEVDHRKAQQKYSLSLTTGQIYVLRELRALYASLDTPQEDLKPQITQLETAFRRPCTAAVKRQLNVMRRNGVTGVNLLQALTDVYHEHGMHELDYRSRNEQEYESGDLPRIICSEAIQ